MKLKLESFSAYDDEHDMPHSVGAVLCIEASDSAEGTIHISSRVTVTFQHPAPRDLTFREVERLATERVLEAL
ncbi:hypothetical protein ABE473_05990 [Stenotrophomonas sp. TWI700]|uniref:hypothetical protein n=1 Tax=Stenotrophomonas TaxID=40323 RepID=UPI0028A7AB18|nr:hypothetical protein [Stenotrophomonas rhizophila]